MRVIIQKSQAAQVTIAGTCVGQINKGYVLLVGVTHDDTEEDVSYCANKIAKMRLFEDEAGKLNLSLADVQGQILSVSQFTLYGNVKKGNRPSFIEAARPEQAEALYLLLNDKLRALGYRVETGQFGAMMQVSLQNDGPTTIILDSKQR